MRIVKDKIELKELKTMAASKFGSFIKAVVDVEREIMALGAELHADEEALLLENDSEQKNLWGINLYPELEGDDFIEFDSMINVRPSQGNASRGVDAPELREKIKIIVNRLAGR